MLEELRKHSRSIFSKLIFGAIALIFALYFGFSFRDQPPGGPAAPIAKVNGEAIPLGELSQGTQNQMKLLEQFNPGKIPNETVQVVESQVLQRLIADALFAQAGYRLGLRVPDVELASEIRKNPAFQREGAFSESFYLDQFKPYYERQYGEDYEYSLKEELLADKLKDAIEASALVSDQQVGDLATLDKTQLNVRKLSVAVKDEKGEKTVEHARKLTQDWIAAKKSGSPLTLPKNDPLVLEEETGLKPLIELQILFGREDSLTALQCLLEIKPGEVCDQPFQIGDQLVAMQLVERKEAAPAPEKIGQLRDQLKQAKKLQLLTAVKDLLTQDAKIETFLTKGRP